MNDASVQWTFLRISIIAEYFEESKAVRRLCCWLMQWRCCFSYSTSFLFSMPKYRLFSPNANKYEHFTKSVVTLKLAIVAADVQIS